MYVKSIELKGFMPYRHAHKLEFRYDQIIGITGQYGEDSSRSNRSGKSSFIDAQVWCLYGKSRAKRETELIHDGCEACYVTLELYDPLTEKSVWITRSRTADNKGGLEVRGLEGEKKRATQEEIDKLVGLSYEEFLFTAFFKQNDIDQFMEADPARKKEILMRWLQFTNWETYAERARVHRLNLLAEKTRLRGAIDAMPTDEVDVDALKAEFARLEKDRGSVEKGLEGLTTKQLEHKQKLKELRAVDDKREQASQLANEIIALKNKRVDSSAFTTKAAKIEEGLKKYPLVTKARHDEVYDKREQFISKVSGLNYEIRDLEKQLSNFGREMTGVCPILQKPCDRIEPDLEAKAELEAKIGGLKKKLAATEETREKASNILKVYQWQQDLLLQKEKLENQKASALAIEEKIAAATQRRAEILKSIPEDVEARKADLLKMIDALDDEKESDRRRLTEMLTRMGEVKEIVKAYQGRAERLAAMKTDLESVEEQLTDVQYVEYMFGKNGIPSMELENSYGEIERDANLILKNLRAPFHIEFSATRELKDWEPNCLACNEPFERGEKTHRCKECGTEREKKRRDELSLTVIEGEREREFYMDSGGGKILLSAAIRLALTQLARRRRGSGWGVIYLDEIFGQLDATNRRLMADLVTSTLLGDLGFEQVFLISHDPNIQSSMADQLIVRRNQERGYSELLM